MSKIGIVFCGYNCANYLERALQPWLDLKEALGIAIAVTNGRYSIAPKKEQDPQGALSFLKLVGKDVDFLLHAPCNENPWTEEQGRNYALQYLIDQGVELIWAVDGDEIYTTKQIVDILNFVREHEDKDFYYINFKNYTFKYPYWIDGFHKSVIYWTNRNIGVERFYFDCDIAYRNGMLCHDIEEKGLVVPKTVAFVDHFSWLQGDPRVEDKIYNQNLKYIGEEGARCSFKLDDGRLVFNERFYELRNIRKPLIFRDLYSEGHFCDIDYIPKDNKLHFSNIAHKTEATVQVADIFGHIYYQNQMSFAPGTNYWVAPAQKLNSIDKIKVLVFDNQNMFLNRIIVFSENLI